VVERDISRWRYAGLENRILIRLAWIFGGVWLFALFVGANVGYYVTVHEPSFKKTQAKNAELRRQNFALSESNQVLSDRILILNNVLSDFGIAHGSEFYLIDPEKDTAQSQEPKRP